MLNFILRYFLNFFCGMTFEVSLNDSYEGVTLTYSFSRRSLFPSFLIPILLRLVLSDNVMASSCGRKIICSFFTYVGLQYIPKFLSR